MQPFNKVFVTGGAQFIGNRLMERLARATCKAA